MRKAIILGIIMSVILISCTKATLDSWPGTYNGTGTTNNINRILVTANSGSSLKMELQTTYNGVYITYATIQNATLSSSNTASVNENGLIAGDTTLYHFSGSGVLSGTNMTLSGTATSVSNPSNYKLYYFTGSK